MTTPIRLLLVDDHAIVRRGLATFLKAYDDFTLVGEAANGVDAITLCEELKPDVVLMDMVMPQMDGIAATRVIRQNYPNTQIVILTSFADNENMVQSAMQAGALGYFFKDAEIDELARAIRTVHEGNPVLSPQAMRMLIHATSQPPTPSYNLSERELEVLKLMVEGFNNRQIAEALTISYSTVKFHVSSILSKMGVMGRTEAVALALQHKLVT